MSDYEKFQLQWMIDHGHSLRELMEELQSLQYDDPEDSDQISTPITELFERWEQDRGFGSKSGLAKPSTRAARARRGWWENHSAFQRR